MTPALQVSLLGAAPTKEAALTTPLPLVAAALLVTGTFGLGAMHSEQQSEQTVRWQVGFVETMATQSCHRDFESKILISNQIKLSN